jgi:hypothetical protein
MVATPGATRIIHTETISNVGGPLDTAGALVNITPYVTNRIGILLTGTDGTGAPTVNMLAGTESSLAVVTVINKANGGQNEIVFTAATTGNFYMVEVCADFIQMKIFDATDSELVVTLFAQSRAS